MTPFYRYDCHQTDYQVRVILQYNRDGSPDRQKSRHQILILCVKQLQSRGYGRRWDIHRLGRREVHRLVAIWRAAGLSHRTIANRMVDIRWLAKRVGRAHLIPTNREIGIPKRNTGAVGLVDKSRELDYLRLNMLGEREQLITELRREFGLRVEESLKFNYSFAVNGFTSPDYIRLKGSWCKGGRERVIQVVTDRQRNLLNRVQRFQNHQPPCKKGHTSMIPSHRKFKSYYKDYYKHLQRFDIPGHALRHCWAQERFVILSGLESPLTGGPKYSELSKKDQCKWDYAAGIVNHELGHGKGRQDITAIYIGARK